jgi:magnesium transporter
MSPTRTTDSSPPQPTPSVVASVVYSDGRRVAECPVEDVGRWAREPGHFVWVGTHEPKSSVLRALQSQFGLHDLAVEDALHAHQRPKLEIYGETLFVVMPTARLADGRIVFGETHVFLGETFALTVRHGASTSYVPLRARCEANPALLREGPDFVLYTLMDYIVDNYAPVIEALETETEDLNRRLLKRSPTPREIERIYFMRRDLEKMRRAVTPVIEMCHRIEFHDLPAIDPRMRTYFRDVSDHVTRVADMLASIGEMLSFVFEASMMLTAARQNDISRKLTAGAALLAVPTAITGIYGMNFENMPELKNPYGYYVVLVLIIGLCALVYYRFKKSGWL